MSHSIVLYPYGVNAVQINVENNEKTIHRSFETTYVISLGTERTINFSLIKFITENVQKCHWEKLTFISCDTALIPMINQHGMEIIKRDHDNSMNKFWYLPRNRVRKYFFADGRTNDEPHHENEIEEMILQNAYKYMPFLCDSLHTFTKLTYLYLDNCDCSKIQFPKTLKYLHIACSENMGGAISQLTALETLVCDEYDELFFDNLPTITFGNGSRFA